MKLTVHREPQEHGASLKSSLDLVNPLVVEGHPLWALLERVLARLHVLPEVVCLHVLHKLNWVRCPSTLHRRAPKAHCCRQYRPCWRGKVVHVAAQVKDDWTDEKDDGGKGEGEIEANILG